MYFNGQFKQLGVCDVATLTSLIRSITEVQWQEHNQRQQLFEVHSQTQTIPLLFDADYRHRLPSTWPALTQFKHPLVPLVQKIVDYYKNQTIEMKTGRPNPASKGYFIRILLVRLAPHSEIPAHKDHGFSLSRAHRIHLPIISNEQVEFTIDGVTKILKEGELWEINNRGSHSVKNRSTQPRIHFIFDFVIPGEIISDPLSGDLCA